MSAAVVHRPNTILPKFNFLLAGGAVVLSIIAITDNVGSNTATATKPATATAATVFTQKAGAGTARPQHAAAAPAVRGLHEPAEYFQRTPAVEGRLMDESRLVNDIGVKVVAPAQVAAAAQTPSVRRLMDDIGPVANVQQVSAAAGVCGLTISTQC